MNAYEQKQEARAARLTKAAARAADTADQAFTRAHASIAGIPVGQPILVGHHSEARHRAALRRHDAAMDKGVAEYKRAEDLRGRAAAVGTGGISSDDPDAVVKLRAELADVQAKQARMKAVNAAWRKGGVDGLVATGFTPEQAAGVAAQIDKAYSWDKQPYPKYAHTNNGANVRRIETRIAQLLTLQATPERAPVEGCGWRLYDDAESNRTCFATPDKPSDAIRAALKSYGFRWSPVARAWLRHRSNGAWYAAERVGALVDANTATAGEN